MHAHKIIGQGSFGAVVEPALPNVDEHGNPLTFGPDKVTKIMLKRDDYLKTIADAKTIADNIPSLATNITPYRRTYTENNIASIPHMPKFITSQGDRNGVFMLRMPNLGNDLWKLQRDAVKMATLRSTVQPTQMIRQILKLMRIVKSIGSAGYIHADIRETNVLCSSNGELTIIDFDWMMTPAEIQKNYPVYFYCHPPESMFLLDSVTPIDDYLKSKPDRTEFHDTLYDLAVAYMKDAKRDEFWKEIQLHGLTREQFAHRIAANMVELYDTATRTSPEAALKRFRDIYYHTADSFGLAVALKNFVVAYFHRQEDTDTRRFLRDTLFTAMTNTASKQRMKIERAIIALQDFARVNYPDIQLGEEVSFAGEMGRLGALMNLMSEKRRHSEERRTLRQQVEGLALMTKYLEGITTPHSTHVPLLPPSPPSSGRRTGSSGRKTQSSNRGGGRNRKTFKKPVRETRR
jgi:hypothetical protein